MGCQLLDRSRDDNRDRSAYCSGECFKCVFHYNDTSPVSENTDKLPPLVRNNEDYQKGGSQ